MTLSANVLICQHLHSLLKICSPKPLWIRWWIKGDNWKRKTLIATMFYLWSIMLKPSGELGILIRIISKALQLDWKQRFFLCCWACDKGCKRHIGMLAHTMTSSLSIPGSLCSVLLKEFFILFKIRGKTEDDNVSSTEKKQDVFYHFIT